MLFGERVTLRAVTREDIKTYWKYRNDVEIALLADPLPPRPRSLEEMEADYDDLQKHPTGNPWFAIEADGKFVGQCILHNFDAPSRTCELGITIGDREYWAKGYGREAVSLLLDYAFRLLNMHKVWLTTNGTNERAIRSYLACGFREEGRLQEQFWIGGAYEDAIYMGILRSDWQKATGR